MHPIAELPFPMPAPSYLAWRLFDSKIQELTLCQIASLILLLQCLKLIVFIDYILSLDFTIGKKFDTIL